MLAKKYLGGAFLAASLLPTMAFSAVQTVTPSQTSFNVAAGSTVSFDVVYDASSPQAVTGFGVKAYFDSTKLTFVSTSNEYTTGSAGGVSVSADGADGDGVPATDQQIVAGWFDLGGNWPNNGGAATVLYTATFTAIDNTTINFTGDASAGNTFAATPVTVALIVPDTTAPVVTAPADVSATATTALTAVTLGTATATDDVDGTLTATPDNAGPYPPGVTSVIWSATDAAGNVGMATQIVTVADDVIPPVVDPADPTNTAGDDQVSSATLPDGSAFDPATAEPGTYMVTYIVTDAAGNPSLPETVEVVIAPRAINPENIPTLSEWALILLTMMLALVSFVSTRRKSQGRQF